MPNTINLFIGYCLQGELLFHLHQSPKWQEEQFQQENGLYKAYWENKEYLGFLMANGIEDEQIKQKSQDLKNQLQIYCPKIKLDKHKLYLFPQVFLS